MNEQIDPKRKPTRREALGMLAAAPVVAVSLLSGESRAEKNGEIEYLPTSLDHKELDAQRMKAVDELIVGFWNRPSVRDHITKSFFDGVQSQQEIRGLLLQESQMYLPTPEKSAEVIKKYGGQLTELSEHIPKEKYGIFLDGDEQRLYVLQNAGQNRIQFIKAYSTSTSREAWSNKANSAGTPLGLHYIAEGRKGMLGEVLSPSRGNSRDYVKVPITEKGKVIKKTFVSDLLGRKVQIPAIITSAFLLVGPTTPPTRSVFVHSTNKVHMLGKPDSGGCIRVSNVDGYDLENYVDVTMGKLLQYGKKMPDIRTGTPVMIAATTTASNISAKPSTSSPVSSDTSDTYRPRPRRWNE